VVSGIVVVVGALDTPVVEVETKASSRLSAVSTSVKSVSGRKSKKAATASATTPPANSQRRPLTLPGG
jgi:hypothetical protein